MILVFWKALEKIDESVQKSPDMAQTCDETHGPIRARSGPTSPDYSPIRPRAANKIFFVLCTLKVSLAGIVLHEESWFSRTSAGKSTFCTLNDTDSANFRYTANKKYRSYQVHLLRNILLLNNMHFKVNILY